jgi:hypothetical protein
MTEEEFRAGTVNDHVKATVAARPIWTDGMWLPLGYRA